MTKFKIIEYTPEWFNRWNSFIEESNNGTLFHRLDFLSYHKEKFSNNEYHLIVLKGEQIVALVPLAIFNSNNFIEAKSPYGASFGGIVHNNKLTLDQGLVIVDLIDDYFVVKKINQVSFTFPPINYFSNYSGYIDFALLRKGFNIVKREIFHVLSLEIDYRNQFEKYEGRTRTVLRKIQNDFYLEENVSVENFFPILLEDKMRLNSEPTHSFQEIIKLKELFPQRVFIDMAINKINKSKSAICYFISIINKVIMTFYIAQEVQAMGSNGTTFLLDYGIKKAIEQGYKYFDFGSSTFGYEVKNIGLSVFKESFGSNGYCRDQYFKIYK